MCAALGFAARSRRLFGAPPAGLRSIGLFNGKPLRPVRSVRRDYRADAVVTVLGIPVFARKGVGFGFAEASEAADGDLKIVTLQFAGRSDPQATHGLNCLGSIEELVAEGGTHGLEASTFGFLTSRSDENYSQARKAVLSREKGANTYVAVEGLHQSGHARYEKAYVTLPDAQAKDLPDLAQCIRSRFPQLDRQVDDLAIPGDSVATFLYTIRAAVQSGRSRCQADYIHNAKLYRLSLERSAESERSLSRYTGQVLDLASRKTSTFRFWMDDPSEMPVRIEYHARSYLKIQFESELPPAPSHNQAGRTHETISTPLAVAE